MDDYHGIDGTMLATIARSISNQWLWLIEFNDKIQVKDKIEVVHKSELKSEIVLFDTLSKAYKTAYQTTW